jgi:hypothetical protein
VNIVYIFIDFVHKNIYDWLAVKPDGLEVAMHPERRGNAAYIRQEAGPVFEHRGPAEVIQQVRSSETL